MTKDAAADGEDASGSVDPASVKAYEALRCHVLTGSTVDRPSGLVVLLRHGVAAWRARRTAASSRSPSPAPRTAPPHRGDGRHAALVSVLVNMVLGSHQEVGV